jgi:hypothetical protein
VRRLRPTRRPTALSALAAPLLVALALAGCVPTADPDPTPSGSATSTPGPDEPDPVFDPEGGAEDNRAFFDLVNQRVVDGGGELGGRSFVDALVEAGFPKEAMEVTADSTSVQLRADNVQFSVRFDDGCLIGQFGNIGYASTTSPVLQSTDRCLVGQTRPIDW